MPQTLRSKTRDLETNAEYKGFLLDKGFQNVSEQ